MRLACSLSAGCSPICDTHAVRPIHGMVALDSAASSACRTGYTPIGCFCRPFSAPPPGYPIVPAGTASGSLERRLFQRESSPHGGSDVVAGSAKPCGCAVSALSPVCSRRIPFAGSLGPPSPHAHMRLHTHARARAGACVCLRVIQAFQPTGRA